jgi:hypothetical protein
MWKQDVNDTGEYARGIRAKGHQIMLPAAVKLFPSPRSREGNAGKPGSLGSKHNAQRGYLDGMIQEGLLPTPTTQETEHPSAELTETGRRKSKNGKESHGLNLADTVQRWPTPQEHNHMTPGKGCRERGGRQSDLTVEVGGQLNPTWVEWLMGFPLGWTDLNA